MHNLSTPSDIENGEDSPILSVRLTPAWKWALRKIAIDAGYATLTDYIVALLKEHTAMETIALLYPKDSPGSLQNSA